MRELLASDIVSGSIPNIVKEALPDSLPSNMGVINQPALLNFEKDSNGINKLFFGTIISVSDVTSILTAFS